MDIPKNSWERHKWIYHHKWVWKESSLDDQIWKEWSWFITSIKLGLMLLISLSFGSYSVYNSLISDRVVPLFGGIVMIALSILLFLVFYESLDTAFWYKGGANYTNASRFEIFIAKLAGKYFDEKKFVDSLT